GDERRPESLLETARRQVVRGMGRDQRLSYGERHLGVVRDQGRIRQIVRPGRRPSLQDLGNRKEFGGSRESVSKRTAEEATQNVGAFYLTIHGAISLAGLNLPQPHGRSRRTLPVSSNDRRSTG